MPPSVAPTLTALADPHRLWIVEILRSGPRVVGDLTAELAISQPSTSKHLRVLRAAGLVTVEQQGPQRIYALAAGPFADLDSWLAPYRRLWTDSLDRLGRRLDEIADEHPDSTERPNSTEHPGSPEETP